ncbi:hypothetical protein [Actinomycetospora cinnamomea]|uniref:Uncharacterized protein n=1 Tax=Actinomycetospora cinnamomea TaxID=663609 RepID=A0A2U1F8M6_9PSEU|nr:hypothetical protein [Actinomycetospora cinnamomea]PVZ08545.1 hypothetical protein C8D89_108142 [Actinomycetospora cinnamomea]
MSHARPEPPERRPWPPREAPTRPYGGGTPRRGRRPTPPSGFPAPAPGFSTAGIPRAERRDRLARPRRRLVGLARVLAGGLVVLAVVVLLAPSLLGGPGPGTDTVVGHVVGAVLAVGATAVAAHPRTPSGPAVAAAAAVPALLLVVLWSFWWA